MVLILPVKIICLLLLMSLFAQPMIIALQQESNFSIAKAATDSNATGNSDANNSSQANTSTQVNTVTQANTSTDEHLSFMKEDSQLPTEQLTGFGLLLRTVGALLLILGLLVAGAWLLRRSTSLKLDAAINGSPLTVISTTNIGDKQSLSVVKFGSKTLLVGATGQNIKVLASEKSEENEIAEEMVKNAYSVKDLLDATELAEQHKLLKY